MGILGYLMALDFVWTTAESALTWATITADYVWTLPRP